MMDEFIEEMEKEEVLKMDKFDSRENIELDKEIIDKILFNKDPKEIKEDKDG